MQTDKSSSPLSGDIFYARVFALVTLGVLGFLLYLILQPFFAPLAWALFIAFMLYPLHVRLVRTLRGRASLSAMLLTLATLLMLMGPLAFLGTAFAKQAGVLLQYAQGFATDHKTAELSDLAKVPVLGSVLAWLQESMNISLEDIQGWATEGARTALQFLASLSRKILLGAVGTVVGFVLMMFILFFMIRDGQQMFATLRALVPMSPERKARLFGHLASVLRAVFYGSGVTALVQGALVGIGFAFVGLPSPVVFGVIAALFALVPMAGTPVVWAPAVLLLAAQQRWVAAVFLLGWGIMITTIDNFLRPMLVSGRAQVGTLTVFIGVLGGVVAFGAIGIFVGPLVLALVIALVRFTLETQSADPA